MIPENTAFDKAFGVSRKALRRQMIPLNNFCNFKYVALLFLPLQDGRPVLIRFLNISVNVLFP